MQDAQPTSAQSTLLGPDDPAPFSVFHREGRAELVMFCDHAGRAFPQVPRHPRPGPGRAGPHIAWDIGIAGDSRGGWRVLDAPLLLTAYSRLVIDCNRQLDDPTSIPQESDGMPVPGNRGLTPPDRRPGRTRLSSPITTAVAQIDGGVARSAAPVVRLAALLHAGDERLRAALACRRPVERAMRRMPVPLMRRLAEEPDLMVGDNEPYSGRDEHGYSIKAHAERIGPAAWAGRDPPGPDRRRSGAGALGRHPHRVLKDVLADPALHQLRPRGGDSCMKEPAFTLGIEEEYLLVDRETPRPVPQSAAGTVRGVRGSRSGERVTPEFLRSQIEVGTAICATLGEARTDLRAFRTTVGGDRRAARPGADRRLDPSVRGLEPADAHRQGTLQPAGARPAGAAARRLMICGMHVHVGLEDPELRIDLMSQVAYFLPHLLALTTSSPFWQGEDTGLKSLPPGGVRRTAAHRPAGALRLLGRVRAAPGRADQGRPDRGRQQALVGRAAERALSRRWRCASPMSAPVPRGRARASPRSIAASCACSVACAAPTSAGAAMPPC